MKTLLLSALLSVAAATGALAQDMTKIAVLDAQQVVNDTGAAKRAIDSLTKKRDAAQKKIDEMEKPLLKKREELEGKRATLSREEFTAQEDALRKDLRDFRTKAQNIQEELDKDNMKLRKEITDVVRAVTEEIAKEKGYTMVFPKNLLFYVSGANDITAEVLKKANAKLDK